MKKFILSLLIISSSCISIAQEKEESTYQSPKHHIGLHAGFTTGYGLSYRYWPTKLGAELTVSPLFRSNGDRLISTGLSLLYSFIDNKYIGVYSYVGNSILSSSQYAFVDDINTGITTKKRVNKTEYFIGLGAGFRVNIFKELDLNIQTGYGFYNVTSNLHTSLTGEIGIYYHF